MIGSISVGSLTIGWADLPPTEIKDLAHSIIEHVALERAGVTIDLNRSKILLALIPGFPATIAAPLTPSQARLSIAAEARPRRAGKGLRFVVGGAVACRQDQMLIRLLAKAVSTRDMLLSGSDDSLEAMTPGAISIP